MREKDFRNTGMEDFEKVLDDFFNSWKEDKNCRFLSWEHCYTFFKTKKETILKDKNMLDLASLNLSFYLASWGMYRGSSNILWKDYKIHNELIKNLLTSCKNLFSDNVEWKNVNKAKQIIEEHYANLKITPTDTLITKVLLGIFGCVPAYDNLFVNGLREYNKNHKNIPQKFNESSFNQLQELSKEIEQKPEYKNYPPMHLIDAYFWWTGGGKNAYKNRENK